MKHRIITIVLLASCLVVFRAGKVMNPSTKYAIGQPIDSLHGVIVYYNGNQDNVGERSTTPDNYNLGLKYQCVEYTKRYFYQHYQHKMPETYGNAKDFFDKAVPDGSRNAARDLIQYANPSASKPREGDLLTYDATAENPYGHVAIISKVTSKEIEIIQQNPGPDVSSRDHFKLSQADGRWKVQDPRILGWLRKE